LMPLKVKTAAEFKAMIAALADDLVDASAHLRLLKDLDGSRDAYWRELSQAPTFWGLTFRAHSDAAMVNLCRAYDSHKDTLNLRTFLETVKNHPDWFEESRFRERKRDNPYVDSLAASPRRPDDAQVRADLDSLGDDLVRRLITWRHSAVAHRSREYALNPQNVVARSPISLDDMDTLVERGTRILNRYSDLFDANVFSTHMVGREDYLRVLKAIRSYREDRKAQADARLHSHAFAAAVQAAEDKNSAS
jgi:hypothetical protein